MGRIAILAWLSAHLAAAFEPSTIAAAKLRATADAVPCVLSGTVTMLVNRSQFYLQDESSGVRVAADPYLLKIGERLEVEGWLYLDDKAEFQVRARHVWHTGESAPPQPRLVKLETALAGAHQGELISVRGTVLNVDFGPRFDVVSIQEGRKSLRIFATANPHGLSVFEKLYPGMQVAANGISVPQTVEPEYDGYQLRVRGSADMEIRHGRTVAPAIGWSIGLAVAAILLAAGFLLWILKNRRRRPALPPIEVAPSLEPRKPPRSATTVSAAPVTAGPRTASQVQ